MIEGDHIQECECLPGFIRYELDQLSKCEPIKILPNSTDAAAEEEEEAYEAIEAAVPTPQPPPVSDDTRSSCDPVTSTTEFRPFCKQPDRNLSIWVLPGTKSERCLQTEVAFDIKSLDECAEYCATVEGGPPRCNYLSYNPFNYRCRWSTDCQGVVSKEMPAYQLDDATDAQLKLVDEFGGIMQLFCSYNKNLLDVCKWAVPDSYDAASYVSHLGPNALHGSDVNECAVAFASKCQKFALADSPSTNTPLADPDRRRLGISEDTFADAAAVDDDDDGDKTMHEANDGDEGHAGEGDVTKAGCSKCISDHFEFIKKAGCERNADDLSTIYCEAMHVGSEAPQRKLSPLEERDERWEKFAKENKFGKKEVAQRLVFDPKKEKLRTDAVGKQREARGLDRYTQFTRRNRNVNRRKLAKQGAQVEDNEDVSTHLDTDHHTMTKDQFDLHDFSSLLLTNDDDEARANLDDDDRIGNVVLTTYHGHGAVVDHFSNDDDQEPFLPYDHGGVSNHSHNDAVSPHPTGHFHSNIDNNVTMPTLYSASGLTECFNDCTMTKGCDLYGFNADAMKCTLIGGKEFDSLVTGCERLLAGTVHQTAVQLKNDFPDYHDEFLADNEEWSPGRPLPNWASDILADFSIYMRHETHFTLFNEPPSKYQCDCKIGYHPHPLNWTECINDDNVTGIERCTRLKLDAMETVVVTASAGDDDMTDFDDISMYEDCRVFFDCNGDHREQFHELACTIHSGECAVPRNIMNMEECVLVLDIDAQSTGYECRIADRQAGQLLLNAQLRDEGLVPPVRRHAPLLSLLSTGYSPYFSVTYLHFPPLLAPVYVFCSTGWRV
jgi:hypothetical protein